MLLRIKEYFFPFLVALSAFSLAGAAAFFSVTGLSKLFGGAQGAVIIMASSLEFSKLVTASFLHKYWKHINWKLKTYLTIGTITIMLITSAGIYGFLSSAYSETSNKLENIDGQIALIEQKKKIVQDDISRLESNQKLKQDRVQSLIILRTQQESRVDSLYNRSKVNIAKRVEEQINQSNLEITRVTKEADVLSQKIQLKNDELAKLDTEILGLKSNDVAGEVGPLKYIAKLTGYSMDSVVNFFILLLIFVFDPMAVCLVIATNIALERAGLKTLSDIVVRKKGEDDELEVEDKGLVDNDILEEVKELNQSLEAKEDDEILEEIEEVGDYIDEFEDVIGSVNEYENNESEIKDSNLDKIELKSNDSGDFVEHNPSESINSEEAVKILNDIKTHGIHANEKYQIFLDALYMNGNLNVGSIIPPYNKFIEGLNNLDVKYEEKEVIDFLTICNLLKITDMNGSERKIAKDYNVAKGIFRVLS